MSSATITYRNFAFSEVDDGKRMSIEHEMFKANFASILKQVFEKYGLEARLQGALASGDRVRILDFGCGEGLYLHDMAALLEERKLLAAAQLSGLDINEGHIAVAEEYCKISTPPRPYLDFYVYDGLQPLEECQGLRRDNSARFDFIFANLVTEFLPKARRVVEGLYHSLRPGGILYLRSVVLDVEGEQSWITFHPAYAQIMNTALTISVNPDIVVAYAQGEWLREAGAQQVRIIPDVRVVGGQTEAGLYMLRNVIMVARSLKPILVATGKMSAAQFDALFSELYRGVNPNLKGQHTYIDTLACKPQG